MILDPLPPCLPLMIKYRDCIGANPLSPRVCERSEWIAPYANFRNVLKTESVSFDQALSESCVVAVLMEVARDVVARAEAASAEAGGAAAVGEEEEKGKSTLEVVLSALWNLSAHCGKNKVRKMER